MLNYKNPKVYVSTLLPLGKSGIEALNRFVGAHKRYQSVTELGSMGVIDSKEKGQFQLIKHGIFLTPKTFSSCSYLHATVEGYNKINYGLSLYKNGLSVLGVRVSSDLPGNNLKKLTGKLSYNIADNVIPILNIGQQSLIYALLQANNENELKFKIATYSLVTCDEIPSLIKEQNEEHIEFEKQLEALTDWIISRHKIEGGTLYVGAASMFFVGKLSPKVEKILNHLLYLKTCTRISHQLHTLLWSSRKKLENLKLSCAKAPYRVLKRNNNTICTLSDTLSKVEIFDQHIRNETVLITKEWKKVKKYNLSVYKSFKNQFTNEVDKSIERNDTISQLIKEMGILRTELENRLELLMTIDSTILNITLLTLTFVSVLSITELIGFSFEWLNGVALTILLLGLVSLIFIMKLIRDFLGIKRKKAKRFQKRNSTASCY